jgi:hypothetical protein
MIKEGVALFFGKTECELHKPSIKILIQPMLKCIKILENLDKRVVHILGQDRKFVQRIERTIHR